MVTRHTRSGITWIDLEAPSRDELRAVMDEFGIGKRVEEEIVSPTPYPLILACTKYVYLILHFPTTNPQGGARSQEVDFIVGKKFIITVRYEVVDSLHSLHRVFEAEELLKLPLQGKNAAGLVERIMRHLYSAIREQAEQVSRAMDGIEEEIFAGREREMVRTISLVGRVLLRFDAALVRHEEPLRAFLEELSGPSFFGKAFAEHAAHIQAEHDHTTALVKSYRAVVAELRTTNESLLSAAQNRIVMRLTIISFVALPLTVVASLFGMNSRYTPFVDNPHFFWVLLGIMAVVIAVLLAHFKRRGWF